MSLDSMGEHHGHVRNSTHRERWNIGKIVGQKAPFKPKDIEALRVCLQIEERIRGLPLLNLGIDYGLRVAMRHVFKQIG